jgi:hypothetical protein
VVVSCVPDLSRFSPVYYAGIVFLLVSGTMCVADGLVLQPCLEWVAVYSVVCKWDDFGIVFVGGMMCCNCCCCCSCYCYY